jgi:hypothetical protein
MADSSRKCVVCNNMMPEDASFCQICGHDYRPAAAAAPQNVRRTPMPPLAGGLIMVSGLSQLVVAIQLLVVYGGDVSSLRGEDAIVLIASLSLLMVGPLAAVGGYYAIRRTRFAWALVGGVLTSSLAFVGVSMGAGTLLALGLLGVILLVASKDEFDEF